MAVCVTGIRLNMTTTCSERVSGSPGFPWRRQPRPASANPPALLQRSLQLYVTLLLSLLSYLFFSQCVMTTVEVSGLSMSPTLQNGDRFLLNRYSYWCQEPQRGDLVVIREPEHGEYAVKRIVALPSEKVQMQRNIAHINGQRLMEPYLLPAAVATQDAMMERPLVIPANHYFVMGDNRDNSEDSRIYGAVPRHRIVGVIQLGSQPMAFLRSPASAPVDHSPLLPLPTISAAAMERVSPPSACVP